jgi:hypothetical protein
LQSGDLAGSIQAIDVLSIAGLTDIKSARMYKVAGGSAKTRDVGRRFVASVLKAF